MLRKIFPAPVILILILGLTLGLNFPQTAQARTTSTLTTPSEAAKKHLAAEQTAKKHKSDVKQKNKSTISKKAGKKKTSTVKNKTGKTHLAKNASHKKHRATIAKNTGKRAHLARNTVKKHKETTLAKNRSHKKTRLAKHKGRHLHNSHAKKSKTRCLDVAAQEKPATDPVDLWLAKDAPEKFRQGTNDEELDELTLSILESAFSYLGTPYRYGGTSPEGFDCSGFVRHVFSENGISLGRSSRDQALEGRQVSLYDLKPGDLIFFNMRNRRRHIDHVGLYIGKGQFIHASSNRSREITIEELDTSRYLPRVVEARRVLEYTR